MSSGRTEEREPETVPDLSLDTCYDSVATIETPNRQPIIEQRPISQVFSQVQTAEGEILSTENFGEDIVGFFRVEVTPAAMSGAYHCNILPTPALPGASETSSQSEKIGKFVKHSEYFSLDSRIKSFFDKEWPLHRPSADSLANAGMFYEGPFEENGNTVVDQVSCFKCGNSLRQWEEDDDPVEEHRRLHPSCFQAASAVSFNKRKSCGIYTISQQNVGSLPTATADFINMGR